MLLKLGDTVAVHLFVPFAIRNVTLADTATPCTFISYITFPFLSVFICTPEVVPSTVIPPIPLGPAAGVLNGLFGSGGGVAVVPMLEKADIKPQKAHATSIAIILPLSVLSSILYLWGGHFDFMSALIFIPGGIVGAILGAICLKKIDTDLLRRIFGIVILISAGRMFFR